MVTRVLWLAGVLLAASLTVLAADPPTSTQPSTQDDWYQASQKAVSNPPPEAVQITAQAADLARAAQADAAAKGLADQATQISLSALHEQQASMSAPSETALAEKGLQVRVFISQSMPVAEIDAALASVQAHREAGVVIRGFRKDQKLGDMFRYLRARIQAGDTSQPAPLVDLDPVRFTEAGITSVPALVAYVDDKPVATLRGSVSVARIEARVQEGAKGDLGKEGTTYPVVEDDFIEVLKDRAAHIDVAALKQHAIDHFWDARTFVDIPPAKAPRQFTFDPTFVVNQDIATPGGTILARAGDRINPLDRVPFTQRLVIFDGTSAQQVAAIAPWVSGAKRRVTLLTTRVDRDRGWQELKSLQDSLGQPVYLMTPQVASQFHIQHIPSMVEAEGRVFRVSEVPPEISKDDSHVDTHAPLR